MSEKEPSKGVEAWLIKNRAHEHTLGLMVLSLIRWVKTMSPSLHSN